MIRDRREAIYRLGDFPHQFDLQQSALERSALDLKCEIRQWRPEDQGRKVGREGGEEKDYYARQRSFGSFERSFEVPDSPITDEIEATFKKSDPHVMLPKSAEAQKAERKIAVKTA
jgi:hypothetical protein